MAFVRRDLKIEPMVPCGTARTFEEIPILTIIWTGISNYGAYFRIFRACWWVSDDFSRPAAVRGGWGGGGCGLRCQLQSLLILRRSVSSLRRGDHYSDDGAAEGALRLRATGRARTRSAPRWRPPDSPPAYRFLEPAQPGELFRRTAG